MPLVYKLRGCCNRNVATASYCLLLFSHLGEVVLPHAGFFHHAHVFLIEFIIIDEVAHHGFKLLGSDGRCPDIKAQHHQKEEKRKDSENQSRDCHAVEFAGGGLGQNREYDREDTKEPRDPVKDAAASTAQAYRNNTKHHRSDGKAFSAFLRYVIGDGVKARSLVGSIVEIVVQSKALLSWDFFSYFSIIFACLQSFFKKNRKNMRKIFSSVRVCGTIRGKCDERREIA